MGRCRLLEGQQASSEYIRAGGRDKKLGISIAMPYLRSIRVRVPAPLQFCFGLPSRVLFNPSLSAGFDRRDGIAPARPVP
jgi:hypothetical protein